MVAAVLWLAACATGSQVHTEDTPMNFELTSSAFADGGRIPERHTCDAEDAPIPLEWSGLPPDTAELALIIDDPDARGFVHWVVTGIAPDSQELAAGRLPESAREGRNDFGGVGYRGPCPPSGSHRYVITVLALSAPLQVSEPASAEEVRRAAAGITLAEATLSGHYQRA